MRDWLPAPQTRRRQPNGWFRLVGLLADRTVVLILLVFVAIVTLLIWHQARLEEKLVRSLAREEAQRYTEALAQFRTLYTREVVETALKQKLVVTHDYDQGENKGKAIPLPATLSMKLGNEMAKMELGGRIALYSGYPFPWRAEEWQQRDEFAKDAWRTLTDNPDEPFQRFEVRNGRRWLRYATADRMRESCVECHNTHRDTPKRDWKEGDVRGVLEVSLPLYTAVAQTRSNLQESAFFTVGVGGLGLVALMIVIGRLRGTARELEQRVESRTAQLGNAERRFRTAVEAAAAAIILVDRDGTILLANDETLRLFGYGPEELLGKPVEVLVPERVRAEHPSLRDGFFAATEPRKLGQRRDLFGLRRDGSEIPVEIGLSPLETDEEMLVLATIVDLTQRKRWEDDLRNLNTALSASNEQLQQFAYVASHDLQEPLRMVTSYLQLLAKRYQGRLDSDADDFIEFAVDGAVRMQRLIQDLLALSRVTTRGDEFVAVDCEAVLEEVLRNLDQQVTESGATVTWDALPSVGADRTQLGQLLQNLISNAIKYRGKAPPKVHVTAERKGDAWLFSVRDNGIGIDPAHRERVFGVFQRLHTAAEYPGTGIGLALCKRIVERHGGRIWVESEPGKGSVFQFTIAAPERGD